MRSSSSLLAFYEHCEGGRAAGLRCIVYAYDMALRGLRGGLRTTLRLGRACRITCTSVLTPSQVALTEGLTIQPAPFRPSCAQHLQSPGRLCFSAQAQALAEAPAPEAAPSRYRIQVVTGDVRGAGTQAPAIITLYGESGGSSDYIVGNEQDESGFERGSSKKYELNMETDLGPLKRIHVEQCEPSVTDTGSGWFLDKIEVTGPNGQTVMFPCYSWIGKNDAGDISGTILHCNCALLLYLQALWSSVPCKAPAVGVASDHNTSSAKTVLMCRSSIKPA